MRKFDIELNEEMIVEEMSRRGLECRLNSVVKNGKSYTGIEYMCEGDCHPTLYLKDFVDNDSFDSFEEMCDKMEDIFLNSVRPNFNIDRMTDKEYLLNNVFVCIQKHNDIEEDLISIPLEDFEDLDKYYRIRCVSDNGTGSFKVKKALLDRAGLTVEELDKYAMKHLMENTEFYDLADIVPVPSFVEAPPMYVLSNAQKWLGASSILNYDALEAICTKLGNTELIIIPSSIHEVIILPKTDDTDITEVAQMINAINESELTPDEILSDHPYEWSLIA